MVIFCFTSSIHFMSDYITTYPFFWVWVTSPGMNFTSSVIVHANFKMSLFFFFCWVIRHYANVSNFVYPLFNEGHLVCFSVLAIMNNVTLNIVEHVSFWYDWVFFRYMPRSRITGSWGRLISNFLRSVHTDLQSDCPREHSHKQW